MQQAQLFKRLHAMAADEIHSFIDSEEQISKAMYKLDLAARTRRILNSIQLEDMWQAQSEEGGLFHIYLSMRLSPDSLCSCIDFKEDMNSLEWRLVFPKIHDLADELKPQKFGDYWELLEKVEIIDVEEYDIELACQYLDQAYDFSGLKSAPPSLG